MARFSPILLISLFFYSSFANSEPATFPVKGVGDNQICESVTRLKENCGAHFYASADTRASCCRLVKAIMGDCLRRNLNHGERKSISIAKRFCSGLDTESPPLSSHSPSPVEQPPPTPPLSEPISSPASLENSFISPSQTPQPASSPSPTSPSQPNQTTPTPPADSSPPPISPSPPESPPPSSPSPQTPSSPPEPSPLPPPQSTPDPTPHSKRPATCLVSTVLYDSCDPKYPVASSNGSSDDISYFPVNVSTGFMTDGAGCCLGYAMFTNDCNAAIKDLSFANQKVFDNLQRSCTSPFHRP